MSSHYSLENKPAAEMRRKELAQEDGWIRSFLNEAIVGRVATLWEEQPFITSTTFLYDPQSLAIYFHSNISGRMRANIERHPLVCFEVSRHGRLLPSNIALEFSIQYESVVVFGTARLLSDLGQKRHALTGLIRKYFPEMVSGEHYRPVTTEELKRTAVYAISIDSWSGKRNWPEQADQGDDWPSLPESWLAG
jgi:hypothetical protein